MSDLGRIVKLAEALETVINALTEENNPVTGEARERLEKARSAVWEVLYE